MAPKERKYFTSNWLILRNPKGEGYWVKESK